MAKNEPLKHVSDNEGTPTAYRYTGTPENMKNFLKGFLSVTAPVAMGLNIVEDDSR